MTAPIRKTSAEWHWLSEVAGVHGDAFYVIDLDALTASVETMRRTWSGVGVAAPRLAYSVKANPVPALLRHARQLGMGAEVASASQLWLARRAGFAGTDIILTGVTRGKDVLHEAMSAGVTIVLDGTRDVEMAMSYPGGRGAPPARVLLRVRVSTTEAPAPRFGMTPHDAVAAARRLREAPAVEVAGLHGHSVDRSLAGMPDRLRVLADVAETLFPGGPAVLDVGSCMATVAPGFAAEAWAPYAAMTVEMLRSRGWAATQVVLEPGAPVVSHTTQLAARILDVRAQPGRTVATIAASILHSSPIRRRVDLPVRLVERPGARRPMPPDPVFLAGASMIDGDWLALDLPWAVEPDDFVVIEGAGAYSIGLDHSFFAPPLPVVLREGAAWVTARRRLSHEELLAGYVW